jgi:hybrid cluster-associated redox disulfide protein
MKKIDLYTTVETVLENYPETKEFFESKKMYCWTCKGKKHETIMYAATYYGLDPEKFLNELKEFIKNKENKLKKVK